jgi:hypothetical protein
MTRPIQIPRTNDYRETEEWRRLVSAIQSEAPTISTGVLPPTTTPEKVGDMFVDTAAKKIYFAIGTTASTDWQIVN